ncbi:hypothetical protein D3C72_1786030 [compost metagenome]
MSSISASVLDTAAGLTWKRAATAAAVCISLSARMMRKWRSLRRLSKACAGSAEVMALRSCGGEIPILQVNHLLNYPRFKFAFGIDAASL